MNRHRTPELEIEPGKILRRFTEQEAIQWAEKWISVYAQDTSGANIKAYLWHTFSFDRYPSVCKHEAEESYKQQVATEIVVLSNSRRSGLLTDALPDNLNYMDYCVFPTNLAWTMAFTHEDGWYGPHFAKHPNYKELVAQEAEAQRTRDQKQKEVERAKQKGWL